MSLGAVVVAWDDVTLTACADALDAPPMATAAATARPARALRAVRRIEVMSDLSGGVSREATDLVRRSGLRNRTAD
jgi:hypothetical protein